MDEEKNMRYILDVDPFNQLQYEFKGIKNVINEYSDSCIVDNFLDGLEQGIANRDKDKITYFLNEINIWYTQNWQEICNDEYVVKRIHAYI